MRCSVADLRRYDEITLRYMHHGTELRLGEMGTGSAAGGRNMARRTKRLAAIACAVAALALMAGCTPKGAAVGDTQNNETYEHNHNENTGARLDVAVIGSPHGGAG